MNCKNLTTCLEYLKNEPCVAHVEYGPIKHPLHETLFSIFLLFCCSHYKMWLQGKLTAATYQENSMGLGLPLWQCNDTFFVRLLDLQSNYSQILSNIISNDWILSNIVEWSLRSYTIRYWIWSLKIWNICGVQSR